MKEVEILFALCTPGHPIKAQCCSDFLIEEVMEANRRQPDGIIFECVSQCVREQYHLRIYKHQWNSVGTTGSTWSLK